MDHTLTEEQRTAIKQRIQPFLKEFILRTWDPKRVLAWCCDHEELAAIALSVSKAKKESGPKKITLFTRISS